MTRLLRILQLALAGLLLFAHSAAGSVDLEQALASLREAVARHPDDPDYSWALGDALEAADRPADAAVQMREHLARWPERPLVGWRALGRCEYRAGHFEPARDALQKAIARDPGDAEAQLYMGLTLQALGDRDRAEQHLEMAARLDPRLAGDALLLAGISHLSRGDTDRGHALLERVMDVAPPDSDSARQARALMDRDGPEPSPLRLEAFTSFQYDSNATQEGGSDLPGAGEADPDFFSGFGTRLSWRPPLVGESRPLELVGLYERYDYLDLTEFSQQRFLGGAGWTQPLGSRAALRLAANGSVYTLDNELDLVRGQAVPTLFVDLGKRRGILRVYGVGEILDYDEDPLIDSLERGGWEYGGGAEHQLFFGGEQQLGYVAWGGRFDRHDGDDGRDILGFANAYERDRWRASTRAQIDLPFEISAYADFYVDAERYAHRNLVDALSEEPTSPDKRRDLVLTTSFSLRRKLVGPLELELLGGYEDRDSNVGLYAYRRATAGMRLHASFP